MRNMLDQYKDEKDHDQRKIQELMMRLAETVKDNARLKESQNKTDEELTTIKVEKEKMELDVNRQKEDLTGLKHDFYNFIVEKGGLQEDLKKVLKEKENLQQQLKEEQLKRTEKEKVADKEYTGKKIDKDSDAEEDGDKQSLPSPPKPNLCQKEVKILKEGWFKITVTAEEYPKEELKNLWKDFCSKVTHVIWQCQWGASRLQMKINLADEVKEKSQNVQADIENLMQEMDNIDSDPSADIESMLNPPEPDYEELGKMMDKIYGMDEESNKGQEEEKESKGRGIIL